MNILYLDNLDEPQAHGHLVVNALEKMGHIVFNNQAIGSADLVLVIRGEHQDLRKIRAKHKCPIVLWNWEPPGMPYLTPEKLDMYDYIFNSSKANNEWVKERTDTPCMWLTQPIEPNLLKPMRLDKVLDVVYIGTKSALRWNWLNHINRKGINITVFGNGWHNEVTPVYHEQFNKVCNQAKVCLVLPAWTSPNFTGTDLKGRHYSLKEMMYLATGALVVAPENPDFEELFHTPDYIPYSDLNDCIAKIRKALKMKDYNSLAWKEIQEKYTYEKQLGKLIEVSLNGNK